MGEPTRFRIVGLLAQRAQTVGEITAALGALQPQTTKHIQALELAGVVAVHRLGRRRVVHLNRETLAGLAYHLGSLVEPDPDDTLLDEYSRAIAREEARLAGDASDRVVEFERRYPVDGLELWRAWTDPAIATTWWAPNHFSVTEFDLVPEAGAPVRVSLREGDGAEYHSIGRVEAVGPGRLAFTLAPVDAAGQPLFDARYTLQITGSRPANMCLRIEVSNVRSDAAPVVAGVKLGWRQLLDHLDTALTTGSGSVATGG